MLRQVYSTAEKADILRYLRLSIDRLELQFSELAADFAQSDQYDEDGFNTPLDWLRINCHLTAKQAGDRIVVGSANVGRSKAALERGAIGFAHLVVIARTAKAVGQHVDEESLVEMATELSPGKLFYRCEQYRHSVDAKGYGQQQGNAVENRYLHLSRSEDGCLMLSGMIDPVGGAALRTALEPLSKPSGADDHRTLPQRNADGLVEMACCGKPASLQITASVETVKALVGSTRRRERVHAADRRQRDAAPGLRLQRDAGAARPGIGDRRCRPYEAHRVRSGATRAQSPRRALSVAGL